MTYKTIVESVMLHGAETWTINTQQKLLTTETANYQTVTRKFRDGKTRNNSIRHVMEVENVVVE